MAKPIIDVFDNDFNLIPVLENAEILQGDFDSTKFNSLLDLLVSMEFVDSYEFQSDGCVILDLTFEDLDFCPAVMLLTEDRSIGTRASYKTNIPVETVLHFINDYNRQTLDGYIARPFFENGFVCIQSQVSFRYPVSTKHILRELCLAFLSQGTFMDNYLVRKN
jgi:hypothetical protein